MAKKFYVFSTLSASQEYAGYAKGGGDLPVQESAVFIAGGANVADKRLVTPRGVATTVDADQLALLKSNEVFNLHVKNGYITVSEKNEDPEVVAADMQGRSPDAPLVEGDFEGQPGAKPSGLPNDPNAVGDAQAKVSNARKA